MLSVGNEESFLLLVLVWFRFDLSEVVLSRSGKWVSFIMPLGLFLRSDVIIAFVMRWFAVWGLNDSRIFWLMIIWF